MKKQTKVYSIRNDIYYMRIISISNNPRYGLYCSDCLARVKMHERDRRFEQIAGKPEKRCGECGAVNDAWFNRFGKREPKHHKFVRMT